MKRSLLIHIYIVIFSSVCFQQMPRWHNSKRLLSVPDSVRVSLLTCAAGERFIPIRTHCHMVRELYTWHWRRLQLRHVQLQRPSLHLPFCLGRNGLSTWSNRLWAFRRIQLSGTRCLATNVKPNRRGKRTPDSTLLTENYRPKTGIPLQFFYDN